MGRSRAVVLAVAAAIACEPTLSVTPQQLDGFHRTCSKRLAEGYALQSSSNVGFTAKKPAGTPIVIYGADWCEPCHVAAAYLERRGIPFVEFDVEHDAAARAEMQATLRAASVAAVNTLPVLDIRGTVMAGFNPCVVDAAWAG